MRRIQFIHQHDQWPDLQYNCGKLTGLIERVSFLQGQLHGRMESYSPELRKQAIINALSSETMASCAIEDTHFDYTEIESAIARSLRIRLPEMVASSGMAKGAAEAVIAGISNYDKKLTADTLFQWQARLYPGISSLQTGAWRNAGLEIRDKSGLRSRFIAPSPGVLPAEMKKWLVWMNQDRHESKLIKSAIAPFWFLTLHPFADGNGLISRIISLMIITSSENGLPRYYAPSIQLLKEKDAYFQLLESSQKGNLDITEWIQWYLGILEKSILEIKSTQTGVIARQKLEDKIAALGLTGRQKTVLRKMAAREKSQFTSNDWALAGGYSNDTALREIRALLNLRILQKLPGGGRSTRYRISL